MSGQMTVRQLREALSLWTGNEDAHVVLSFGETDMRDTPTPTGFFLDQPKGYDGSHLFILIVGDEA